MNEAFARVPELLAEHVLLSLSALLFALLIAAPLAIAAARRPRLATAALGFASLVQTIPSLALLALFFPLLLWLGGGRLPALGFLPSLLALTLYALLPLLRNGVAALRGIDPAVIEAADAVGMTRAQRLRLVEAPLAAPVAIAGLRTAAVWTIGAATLSTTVGQPGLGDLIFAGLQTQSWPLVLAGCVAAAGLALAVDALMGLAERGIATRRRRLWLGALALLGGGLVASTSPLWWRPSDGGGRPLITVGAKNFGEQYILARLIGQRLERAGYRVRYREGLGSAVIFGAVASGAVDVYVDYAGTIWTNAMQRRDVPERGVMLRSIAAWTAHNHRVRMLGALGFENAYAFAMQPGTARTRGIATLADLAARSPTMRLGSDLEFLERPEWAAVRRAYPMRFAAATPYSPTFMYRALASGRADVITAFSSDGRIAAERLTVLTDPRHAIPGYDAILLVAPGRAKDARFTQALAPLVGRIPVAAMREANLLVDREADKQSPDAAARWLAAKLGL
ncbi:ABC transporter permease [Sphingomonas metalli]|uniref:ABC transporter permease n=1 Tax=Sphingomonas metalli TaxID=1779358 RepID=A0A916WRG0_9SPHN|nr:glycine betaine ABC transporter substrate-binding protein [Sphingomonas metalli]GGB25748.1 ABC transporter permease [Sphingomonas metalli]